MRKSVIIILLMTMAFALTAFIPKLNAFRKPNVKMANIGLVQPSGQWVQSNCYQGIWFRKHTPYSGALVDVLQFKNTYSNTVSFNYDVLSESGYLLSTNNRLTLNSGESSYGVSWLEGWRSVNISKLRVGNGSYQGCDN